MSLKKERFIKGIILAPDTIALDGLEGEIKVDSATGKIQVTLKDGANPSIAREILTSSQTQTLTNKTIDVDNNIVSNIETDNLKAGVLNTSTSLTGASDTQVPSALAAKTYIDTANTAQQNIIDDLVTLSGVASGAENLGTFTGTTIPDNSTNKQALQALETEVETKATSAALSTHTGASSDVHGVGVGNSVVGTGTSQALTNKTINADLNTISNIEDADIKVGAAISRAKLASGTANRVVVNNGTGVQTDAAAITASRALVSDANGIPTHSTVTTTTLEFLDATSSVQTQLNSKVNASGGTLTNGSIVTPVRSDVKQDTKANLTTYALTATNGQLVFATDTKELFQVIDGLLKAAGGVGGAADVNALLIQTFDTSAVSDFTQTGLSLTTTNPVNGAQSAALTHQTGVSPTNDQLFTQTISVDRKFRGQLMQLSLNVRSTASSGNLTVSVRDVTNSAAILSSQQIQTDSNPFTANTNSNTTLNNISNADMALLAVGDAVSGSNIPTGAVITALGTNQVTISAAATATASAVSLRASSLPARRVFSFTIPANCASLSYTVTALPEANAPRSVIDDVVIELASTALLSTSVEVPNMTAWQGYTPTFQGFGTPTNIEFEWRQVGENVEIRGKFTTGTVTAVETRVGLPNGLTSAGTAIIPSLQVVGNGAYAVISGNSAQLYSLIEPSVTYLTFGRQSSVEVGLTKTLGTIGFASTSAVSFFASVPCSGLSATSTKTIPLTQSGLVQEGDSYLFASGNAGQAITAGTTNIPFIAIRSAGDKINFNGSQITVLESGIYNFNVSIVATTSPSNRIAIFKNGIQLTTISPLLASNVYNGTFQDYFSANDVVSFRLVDNSVTLNNASTHSLSVTYQGSLKQVAINPNSRITIPTSELRFEGASTRGSSATAIVRFDSIARIRGDAFSVVSDAVNGTAVTMLKAGKLDVSSNFVMPAVSQVSLTRNQATLTVAVPLASEALQVADASVAGTRSSLAWSGDVKVGDIIRLSTSSNPTTNATNSFNFIFQEQNIAVSVSNTLPQFSESDSSVRVDTANGFGSTGTRIRRFSNIRENIGADIQYNPLSDEAVNGASFRVMSAGIYNVSYSEVFNSGGSPHGITVNADPTVTLDSVPIANVLASSLLGSGTVGNLTNVAWSGYLNAGDVIRPHSDGGAGTTRALFTISKVGKPNVTGVNVTPFVNVPQPTSQSSYINQTANFSVATITGALTSSNGSGNYLYNSATGIYTALKNGIVNISVTLSSAGSNVTAAVYKNSTIISGGTSLASVNFTISTSGEFEVVAGDTFRVTNESGNTTNAQRISVVATAASDSIITANESFSTDTASLQYASSAAYTLTTLSNAPVGTFLTFTYAANTNTRTQTTTRPTQTDADMNANGMLIYTRAYNAASTAAQPAAIAIQIGKGLKGKSLDLYKSVGKQVSGELDYQTRSNDSNSFGINHKNYNESTGILFIDAGYNSAGLTTAANLLFSDNTSQSSGYLVINASKSPALTGVPLLQPRIATLSDVKASGTLSGTFTSGVYQTRTLNTLVDSTGIVTSLASNQFTLPAGEYYVEASASAYRTNAHKCKIRNITDSTDALIGINAYSSNTDIIDTTSSVYGTIIITSAKTFELQHRANTTSATVGFGNAASFSDNEVFAICKITKIK